MVNKKPIIKQSCNTFFVDRTIFSNTFPDLKGDPFRIYLLMCRVVGANNGVFYMAINTIAKEVNTTEHYVRNSLDFLCNNYFIKRTGKRKQSNVYIVLTVPDYHRSSKMYFTNENIQRNRFDMKDSLNGYCEMPIEIMKGSILRDKTKWTDRRIKILGQLYLYHWIDDFGGVDPEACDYSSNSLIVSDLICRTVSCHINDAQKAVKWLINEDCAHIVKTVYRRNQNSCYKELQFVGDASKVTLQPNDVILKVIRLSWIPDLKLKDAYKRTGGNINI